MASTVVPAISGAIIAKRFEIIAGYTPCNKPHCRAMMLIGRWRIDELLHHLLNCESARPLPRRKLLKA